MRREYEAAIGRLITNQTAVALFAQDQDLFLRDYSLDEDERASILAMNSQLVAMSASFTGKRKRMIERPISKPIALLGEYGDMLLQRYVNFHPPSGDYYLEHMAMVSYVKEALSTIEGVDNIALVEDALTLESMLFQALRSVVPGEELECINDPAPSWEIAATPSTKVAVRRGVFYSLFAYNLSNIMQSEATELSELEPEETALIVFRQFGRVTNTLVRVSPTVLKALGAFGCGNTIQTAAIQLSQESNSPLDVTERNLIALVKQLSAQQVLVEIGE